MSLGRMSRRPELSPTELALVVVLPATVVAFTLGSSSIESFVRVGHDLRWVFLFGLAAVAAAFGWQNRSWIRGGIVWAVAMLGAIGVLSATWSVKPRITAERGISFLLLTAVAVFVAAGAVGSRRRTELVLLALLVAPVVDAAAGGLLFLADHARAVQAPVPSMPERLRGIGENPNTVAMLVALVLPVAAWRLSVARSTVGRVLVLGMVVLLYGTVLASGSRGAMFASAGGVIAFVLVRVRQLRVLVPLVAGLLVLFAGSFKVAGGRPGATGSAAAGSSQPTTTTTTPTVTAPSTTAGSASTTTVTATPGPSYPALGPESRFTVSLLPNGVGPVPFVPEKDEIGYPTLYETKPILSYGSGRVYAWLSAIRQALRRPLLGYGFGTEEYVFIDRFYVFDGGFTENSFVGMFLQLGVVGLGLLLVPFALALVSVVRALRRLPADRRTLIAVGAGTTVGGFLIAFFQSYLYSVGNVATLTFWVILFLAVVVTSAGLVRGQSESAQS